MDLNWEMIWGRKYIIFEFYFPTNLDGNQITDQEDFIY